MDLAYFLGSSLGLMLIPAAGALGWKYEKPSSRSVAVIVAISFIATLPYGSIQNRFEWRLGHHVLLATLMLAAFLVGAWLKVVIFAPKIVEGGHANKEGIQPSTLTEPLGAATLKATSQIYSSRFIFGGLATILAGVLLADGYQGDGIVDGILSGREILDTGIEARWPVLIGIMMTLWGAYTRFAKPQ